MPYQDRLDNVYMIDTKMFGFEHYMCAYLVKGEKLALIDTGVPSSWNALSDGIKKHEFSVGDISHIFVGHEHPDHYGNASRILQENPGATVYASPLAEKALLKSEAEQEADPFTKRAGVSKPVPHRNIEFLKDGDEFDLGGGELLTVRLSPGHLPGAITISEKKNNGLFINDLIGNYFPDAGAHLILLPPGSDLLEQIESLTGLMALRVQNIYASHYGMIIGNAEEVMSLTLAKMKEVLALGQDLINKGQPDKIAPKMLEYVGPYVEAMRKTRGEAVYEYIANLHVPYLVNYFAQYCRDNLKRQ
jgi:glyoxylase-like metal-dependent hydrolase (beta-lactamase superfamily II)